VLLHSHVKVIATDFLRRFGPIVIISKFLMNNSPDTSRMTNNNRWYRSVCG